MRRDGNVSLAKPIARIASERGKRRRLGVSNVKKKEMFCSDCIKTTPHVYAGKETLFDGSFLARGMVALVSLGMSESTWAEHFWQCERCGNVRNGR